MVQALERSLTFDEFLESYPDDEDLYELINGAVVPVKPTGPHGRVAGFIARKFWAEIEEQDLPFFLLQTCYVKPQSDKAGYLPDLVVLDERTLAEDPRWQKESTITKGASAQLVIEITSSNWRDDYERKLPDYEEMGIAEYWIVDYLAIGASRHIGSPKQPLITVYQLIDGEYQFMQFRGAEPIRSQVFPKLRLSVDDLLAALKPRKI
jgi:Uma2 family endonuclease